jgi:hypothetical protein
MQQKFKQEAQMLSEFVSKILTLAIPNQVQLDKLVYVDKTVKLLSPPIPAEIDQIVSTFIFRARVQNSVVNLALFEGDGGRWRLAAVAAIKAWLASRITASPIIS